MVFCDKPSQTSALHALWQGLFRSSYALCAKEESRYHVFRKIILLLNFCSLLYNGVKNSVPDLIPLD